MILTVNGTHHEEGQQKQKLRQRFHAVGALSGVCLAHLM
jgi:hypothetical protein